MNGRNVILPAYVPYVGRRYFDYRPRVLCYAMNQNLSDHAQWTDALTRKWAADPRAAIDRLNRAASDGKAIHVKPYAEGFIPLAALIAIKRFSRRFQAELPDLVDDVLAVTNFVKFSTAHGASSSKTPLSWWRECARRYVMREIAELEPDLVITFGRPTEDELIRAIRDRGACTPPIRLLGCKFPSRRALVTECRLCQQEKRVWRMRIRPLVKHIRRPVENDHHEWRMERFPGYFTDIFRNRLQRLC